MKQIKLLVTLLLILNLTSCFGTMNSIYKRDDPYPYSGVIADTCLDFYLWPIQLIDLPISFILDTILLPYTTYRWLTDEKEENKMYDLCGNYLNDKDNPNAVEVKYSPNCFDPITKVNICKKEYLNKQQRLNEKNNADYEF